MKLNTNRLRHITSGDATCVLGAAVCAVGVYQWRLWPEEWQAGLVFILFGLLVLAPVTIREIQFRRKALALAERPTIG